MSYDDATRDKAIALSDRVGNELAPGLASLWSLADDAYDCWGDAMQHGFAVNDLAYMLGVETDPTFHPSPYVKWEMDSSQHDWPTSEYIDCYQRGDFTAEDIAAAVKLYSTLFHGLELLGVDY